MLLKAATRRLGKVGLTTRLYIWGCTSSWEGEGMLGQGWRHTHNAAKGTKAGSHVIRLKQGCIVCWGIRRVGKVFLYAFTRNKGEE